ncbi:hypothetical protein [Variovorax sp. E3]|uniref:hypothetical protein n=1 Tax=Variovorax sp. E3 TaxID=1914993 RepID=UPI0022B671D6|nr:hypothetical protein [Variovorax sp. E3]
MQEGEEPGLLGRGDLGQAAHFAAPHEYQSFQHEHREERGAEAHQRQQHAVARTVERGPERHVRLPGQPAREQQVGPDKDQQSHHRQPGLPPVGGRCLRELTPCASGARWIKLIRHVVPSSSHNSLFFGIAGNTHRSMPPIIPPRYVRILTSAKETDRGKKVARETQ